MGRIIIFTGKGGVGKTSVAAATAASLAEQGKKVLVMSTDQAHSLSDSFGIKLHKEATPIVKNLYGMELDTVEENERACGKIMKYIKQLTLLNHEDSVEIEELLVFPGLEELLALLKIKEIYEQNEYDAIIVNKIFPQASMEGYFSKWKKMQKEALQLIGESFKGIPIFEQELQSGELRGYEMLKKVGEKMFEHVEADEVLFEERIFEVIKTEQGYTLSISMPFVDKRELSLSQKGDELTLAIKNEKRSFALPKKLLSKGIKGAKYKEEHLEIYF